MPQLFLTLLLASARAQAGVAPFIDSVPDPARAIDGMPGGGCPLYADGFDTIGVGQPVAYVTSGGYSITIDRHTITVVDALAFNKVEHWGDPHENLNGKHIKDWGGEQEWDGSRRSLVLDDGTKLTMEAEGEQGVVLHTSIYDGDENLQVDNCRNALEHHGVDATDTAMRDGQQHDGETARFATDVETAVATYLNVYNEDADFDIVEFSVLLGETGGYENPNNVRDYYDDPRLGHT
jgi:hypothetical protein